MNQSDLYSELLAGTNPTTPYIVTPVAVQAPVHLSVTIAVSAMVGVLFAAVYVQLFLVICFGYKLFSYQTVLLFNILLWAALRLTLYSFYYYHCCDVVNNLPVGWDWLLVSFPSTLQYVSLAVLVHYFGESFYRVVQRRQEMSSLDPPYRKMQKYKFIGWVIWITSVISFIVGNVTFGVLIRLYSGTQPLVIFRVVLLDGLFLVMGITLGVCIIVIYTTRAGRDVIEAQGVHKCIPLLFSVFLIILFTSRATYDLIVTLVVSTDYQYGMILTTDMADYEFRTRYGYIVYLLVLFVWEVIPTYLIVFFFRVRLPSSSSLTTTTTVNSHSNNRKHFFDNPHRYDSETEEIMYGSLHRSSQMAIPSLPTHSPISPSRAGYGSTSRTHYSAPSKYSINNTPRSSVYMPGTTPPQLFTTSPSLFSDHDR